jgi:acetylcholinesterase
VGAVPESTFWPTERTVAEMEFQFQRFVEDTGCSQSDALSCLRSADIATIQAANVASPFPGGSSNPLPLWYFLPVIDGDLITDELHNLFEQGKLIRVPLLVGDDTNEGSIFAFNAATSSDVAQFMKNNYPNLSSSQLDAINKAYPLMAPLPEHAAFFPSASAAYGDSTFTCPGNLMAESLAKFFSPDQVFNYRYNVLDPGNVAAGLGVPHTFETAAIFGPGFAGAAAASYFTTNAAIVPVTMDYFISFVKALDPNPYKDPSAPEWQPFGFGQGQRLKIQTNATSMESVPQSLTEDCLLWNSLAPTMEV